MSKWTPTEATNYFGDDNLFYEIRGHVDGYGDDETIALVDATPLDEDWRWKNAVLLASAPELVEALEPLEASATLITKLLAKMQDEELCDAIANLSEDIAEARKALKAARGGK